MRPLALVALVALVAACADAHNPAAPPLVGSAIAGKWAVTRVNGSPLPYALDQTERLTADVYTLTAASATGGSFTQRFVTTRDSVTATGNYWLDGSTVSLQDNGAALISVGPWKGDTITLASGLLTLTLVRQ